MGCNISFAKDSTQSYTSYHTLHILRWLAQNLLKLGHAHEPYLLVHTNFHFDRLEEHEYTKILGLLIGEALLGHFMSIIWIRVFKFPSLPIRWWCRCPKFRISFLDLNQFCWLMNVIFLAVIVNDLFTVHCLLSKRWCRYNYHCDSYERPFFNMAACNLFKTTILGNKIAITLAFQVITLHFLISQMCFILLLSKCYVTRIRVKKIARLVSSIRLRWLALLQQ